MSEPLIKPYRKGNPNWKKGVGGNPAGRPKSGPYSGIKKTLHKLKRDPIEELIQLADLAKAARNYAMAVGIWKDIHAENSEFPSLEGIEKEGKSAAKLLEEMEQDEPTRPIKASSNPIGLGEGNPQVQTEASPEEDLRPDKEQHRTH